MKRILLLLDNYDTKTHQGVAEAARELGWHLNAAIRSGFQLPARWSGDGMICSLGSSQKLADFVIKTRLPTVDLSVTRSDLDFPRVAADNLKIGQLAAEHLSSFGHTRFAWFSSQINQTSELRLDGFREELAKQDKALIGKLTGAQTQHAETVLNWLKKLARPCAVFAFNDLDAAWLMSLCSDSGYRIPRDIAILGVDNDLLTCTHQEITLSSINHDHRKIGYEGAYMLHELLSGRSPANRVQLIAPDGLTLRDSTDTYAASDPIVQAALEFMLTHFHKPIGTPEISTHLGISRRNLELRFQKSLQSCVHKKLVEMRLKSAEHMLTSTHRKVEDIAARTGFCHTSHLSHAFKKAYGLPPGTYRKKDMEN